MPPSDGKIQSVAGQLTNGRAPGASGMHAEYVKAWLSSIQEEEHSNSPIDWCLFDQLDQAVWMYGIIPRQLSWSIVVLIPKGGSDFHGLLGLLEPIWKVLEWIMDLWLDAIGLHDTLHGCWGHHGDHSHWSQVGAVALIPWAAALLRRLSWPQECFRCYGSEQMPFDSGGAWAPALGWSSSFRTTGMMQSCCAVHRATTASLSRPAMTRPSDPGWPAICQAIQYLGQSVEGWWWPQRSRAG